MQWLSPWAWLGLGALVVPVFVHLFSRRPARSEPFPSLRFLTVSPVAPTRRTRISDWPLLLLRLLMLALAVAALAQPLRRTATTASRGTTIEVLDEGAVGGSNARLTDADTGARIETIRTRDLDAGIAQAIARLRTQPAPRTVHVRASFAAGALDTMLLASLPSDVTVRFTPRPAAAVVGVRADTIGWRTALPEQDATAVVDAVSALGGAPVAITRDGVSRAARLLVVSAAVPSGESAADGAGSDTLTAWAMDRALLLSRDETIRMLLQHASTTEGATRRAADRADRATVLVRNERGEAAIVARMRGPTDSAQLVLQARVPERADIALALLLAASAPHTEVVRSTDAPVDAATLARWARLPAGLAIGAGDVTPDVHTATTDARWLWLVALIVLGIEWLVRRREPAERTADVSNAQVRR